jgi:hypothetical protein
MSAVKVFVHSRVIMFQNTEGKKTGWGGIYSGESVSIICDDPV